MSYKEDQQQDQHESQQATLIARYAAENIILDNISRDDAIESVVNEYLEENEREADFAGGTPNELPGSITEPKERSREISSEQEAKIKDEEKKIYEDVLEKVQSNDL